MYGDGRAEELVAEAMAGRRDQAFLVSKVLPGNASRRGTVAACQRSLRRLKTDRIDLYLLHWPGTIPIAETIEAFLELQQSGKIRHYGVSNLDLAEMRELWRVPGGASTATNQLLYNLARRNIEWDFLPWLRERRVPVMAYSPIEQGRLLRDRGLQEFASHCGMTPAQAALAWLLAKDDIIVIPKTSDRERLRENLGALECQLTTSQLAELDRLFLPPAQSSALEML
jgi:diketogulonate reductase-like aldo/keto reductase